MSPDTQPPDPSATARETWRLMEHVRRVNEEIRAGLEEAQGATS